jgi:hypothetical protein
LPAQKTPTSVPVLQYLRYLEEYPRAVWITRAQIKHKFGGPSGGIEEHLFFLPSFIRPFAPTLSLLIKFRNKAMKEKDEEALGVVVLFLKKVDKYSTSNLNGDVHVAAFADFLEIGNAEAQRMAQVVKEKLEKMDPLLSRCFMQLDLGRPEYVVPLAFFLSSLASIDCLVCA